MVSPYQIQTWEFRLMSRMTGASIARAGAAVIAACVHGRITDVFAATTA